MLQPLSLTTFPLFYVYFIFYGSWKITTYWLGKEKQLLEIDPVKSEANIDTVKSISVMMTAVWELRQSDFPPWLAREDSTECCCLPPGQQSTEEQCTVSCTLLTVICRTTYRHAGQANVYSKLLLHQYGNVIVPLLLSRQGSYL